MRTKSLGRVGAIMKAHSHRGHGDAYRWLVARYDLFRTALAEQRTSWQRIAEAVAAAGVRGARGKTISPDSLRQIWKRVCRDMEVAVLQAQADVTPRKRQPRDLPVTWQPPLAYGHARSTVDDRNDAAAAEDDPFARVRREMEKRSGR